MRKASNMFYIGLIDQHVTNIAESVENAQKNGYTVLATDIESKLLPLNDGREMPENENTENWQYPDSVISPDQWRQQVILMMPSSLDCDAENDSLRNLSLKKLENLVARSSFLQNAGYIMVHLKSAHNINLARTVSDHARGHILVEVPLFSGELCQASWRSDIADESLSEMQETDTWHWWNNFRWATNFEPKMKIVLTLNESYIPDRDVIFRWLGEPVEAVHIPSTMFIFNRHNYPVLSKAWQEVLKYFLLANINILVSAPNDDNALKFYYEYLANLHQTHQFKKPYEYLEDFLEIPLQPLHDNLCCETYDIFEKDPMKYKLYQDAIVESLKDRVPDDEIVTKLTIIMVLGAGRGPLVRCSLNAAKLTGRKVRVYIIEKNPNAVSNLKNLIEKLWLHEDVHLFSKDMREFSPPEKADILVSELLGSFSDNELSPECLDCAKNLLKPDGISIPYKSISFINPIMSSKLLNSVRNIKEVMSYNDKSPMHSEQMSEAAFVVFFKNIFNISSAEPLFEFVHPGSAAADNSRYKKIQFKATMDSVLTGFGGYFEAYLYKDIKISINPTTHTVGMMSWFPLYFPIKFPMDVKKHDVIELHFWRRVSSYKVWYEWMLTQPQKTSTLNRFGHSYPIYLY